MSIKKNVIIPASAVALICAVLLLAINLYIHYDQKRYSSSVENRIESENDPYSEEERIAELENEIRELQRKLNSSEIDNPRTGQINNEQSRSGEETNQSRPLIQGEVILPESLEDLNKEVKTNAEIVGLKHRKDSQFNDYLLVDVRNNYNKTIRSVRISGAYWIDSGSYRKERYMTEISSALIKPGEAKTIRLNKNWGRVTRYMIVVDAVTFTDGTSHISRPPRTTF